MDKIDLQAVIYAHGGQNRVALEIALPDAPIE